MVCMAVIMIQFFELTLLHYKYDIFTGGFLQPFSYKKFSERLVFIFFSLWFDLSLFGMLAGLWFFIADKLNKYGLIIYYNFTVIVLLAVGIFLGLKFKILSFFSDAINLQIIKNLGGGSFKEALIYASDEIALFIGVIGVVTGCFIFIIKLLGKSKFIDQLSHNNSKHTSYSGVLFFIVTLTPILTYFIANNDFLRYGLDKKISYHPY